MIFDHCSTLTYCPDPFYVLRFSSEFTLIQLEISTSSNQTAIMLKGPKDDTY